MSKLKIICQTVSSKQSMWSMLQRCTITLVRRELRGSLVQPPAYSRTTSGIRPLVAQGFVQLDLENIPVVDFLCSNNEQPPWAACPTVVLSSERKGFPYIQPEHLLSQFMLIVPLPPIRHSCKDPGSLPLITSLQALEGCCWVPPKPSLIQGEPALSFSPLGKCSSLTPLWGFSANLTPVYR